MKRIQFIPLACAMTAVLALSACKRQEPAGTAPGSTGTTSSTGGAMSSTDSMAASGPASAASR